MDFNRISATITKEDVEAVRAAIVTIGQTLPFLIELTPTERAGMLKLGIKSQVFVKQALDVAAQNKGMLPVSFDLEEMRKNAELFESLSTIRIALDKLNNLVECRRLLSGLLSSNPQSLALHSVRLRWLLQCLWNNPGCLR